MVCLASSDRLGSMSWKTPGTLRLVNSRGQEQATKVNLLLMFGVLLTMQTQVAITSENHSILYPSGVSTLVTVLSQIPVIISLWWRAKRPLVPMWVTAGYLLFCLISTGAPPVGIILVPVISYSVARYIHGRASRQVLVVGTLGAIILSVSLSVYAFLAQNSVTAEKGPSFTAALFVLGSVFGICEALVVTPYGFGRRIRDNHLSRLHQDELRQREFHQQLIESEQRVRLAEFNTRTEIARELHDIVAHSLSVIVVQAEGGKALAMKKPDKAVDVLETISETGREALTEMRRIVGVLRGDTNESADYLPQPGLDAISALVERSGDRVKLVEVGERPNVSQALELTVYRIVQEGITNFLKHAGDDAEATVTLTYGPEVLVTEVRDNGVGAQTIDDGHGNGLAGMHERVAAMGGKLMARPMASGGFLVRALIPLTDRGLPRTDLSPGTPPGTN